jgi:hypothetical protein
MSTASLAELEPLIGEWEISVPQFPGAAGQVSFEWLPGEKFLVQRWSAPDPAPDGIAVIGPVDPSAAGDDVDVDVDVFVQHYFDSRGVERNYRMSFTDGIWRLWRDSDPRFRQRFQAELSDDGRRMHGAWEKALDGGEWEKDFDLEYLRTS